MLQQQQLQQQQLAQMGMLGMGGLDEGESEVASNVHHVGSCRARGAKIALGPTNKRRVRVAGGGG